MKARLSKPLVLASAIAGLAILPACSADSGDSATDNTTQEDATRTVAAALGELPQMSSLNSAVSASELGSVFDGPASYTLLAPNDGAFEALGDSGAALMTEDQRPVLVALLREHILPGHLTPENISEAIESQGGEVTMTTLGGGNVTFSREGDAISVSNGQGSTASFSGAASAGTNGVIIPLDTVLVPAEEPAD